MLVTLEERNRIKAQGSDKCRFGVLYVLSPWPRAAPFSDRRLVDERRTDPRRGEGWRYPETYDSASVMVMHLAAATDIA